MTEITIATHIVSGAMILLAISESVQLYLMMRPKTKKAQTKVHKCCFDEHVVMSSCGEYFICGHGSLVSKSNLEYVEMNTGLIKTKKK